VHQLFIDFKKACDSVRRGVFYNVFIEFVIPKKLVRLIKMCPNETHSRIQVGKYFFDVFLLRMVCNKEMLYRRCFSTLL